MAVTNVKLIYNPYCLGETYFQLESGKILKNVLPSYMKNKRLQEWLYPYEYGNEKWIGLIPKIAHEIGKNNFTIEFSGRKIDYLDVMHAIDLCKEKYIVDVEYRPQGDTEKKLEQLRCALNKLEESPIERIKEPLIKFAQDSLNGEFQVGVFGNMSAGKSTFINALIGKRVLASSTSECTTKLTDM